MKIKQILQIVVLSLVLAMAGTSCSDWLDVKPRGEEEADRLFGTPDGFKEALAGCYTILCQSELYGRELTFGTVGLLAQEWGSGGNITTSTSAAYNLRRYSYTHDAVRPYIDAIWINLYKAVANLNTLIHYTELKKEVLSEEYYGIIRGEALALRAYVHFDLFRLYANYQGANTYTDSYLAIPYIRDIRPVVTDQFTNKQVIDFILEDIAEALTLLSADPVLSGEPSADEYLLNRRLHLNYYAVTGLKARVCQYAGLTDAAVSAARQVVEAQDSKGLFRWVTGDEANPTVTANRDRTYSSEHLFALNTVKLEDHILGYFRAGNTGASPWMPRVTPSALFDAADYRYRNFETDNGVAGVFSKFWQYGVQLNAFRPVRDRMPMIRITEMYYILIEEQAETNPDQALALLNTVRAARNLMALTFETEMMPQEKTAILMNELLDEYQREFMGEGQLWYFHKRQGTVNISTANADYVFPMPDDEIDYGDREDTTIILPE